MSGGSDDASVVFGRQLLLFGAKREAVLELPEVQRYGADSFGAPDHVSLYGMAPADWYRRGIRLLGGTAVECTSDRLAIAIAKDMAALADSAPARAIGLVIDPFVGSGNTLFWIQRQWPGSRGLGFELDPAVFRLTKQNLASLRVPIDIENVDFATGLARVTPPPEQLVVVFIAPPWGDALDAADGLDLCRTQPPVAEIVDLLISRFPANPLLLAVQLYETTQPSSLEELTARCEWSATRLYDLFDAGQNHGVLLGTRGWAVPPDVLVP